MADEWNSLFNSDDDDSEFEGFSPSDIDETETRSIGKYDQKGDNKRVYTRQW
jgi:hypothetical protein